jgi:hypothetical protein
MDNRGDAEGAEKIDEDVILKFNLCELCVSVVNSLSQ